MRSTSVLNPDTSQLKLLPQITSRNNNATFMQKSKNNSSVSIRKPSIDMSTIVPHYVDSQAFKVAASPSQEAKKFVAKLPESLKQRFKTPRLTDPEIKVQIKKYPIPPPEEKTEFQYRVDELARICKKIDRELIFEPARQMIRKNDFEVLLEHYRGD